MNHQTIVFLEEHWDRLRGLVFDQPGREGAAFVLCGESRTGQTAKLLSHDVLPIASEDFLMREPDGVTISSGALAKVAKRARNESLSILFAHSHPGGIAEFSRQDDREEAKLLPFFQSRAPDRVHGTVVLTERAVAGRLYAPQRTAADKILIVGNRLQVFGGSGTVADLGVYDRQVRAFGREIQEVLSSLRIGIVGVGGTGSLVAEQLYRLGVGHLRLFDGDCLDATNLNRVYNATMQDVGRPKVRIAKDRLDMIGFSTVVEAVAEPITEENAALGLRDCDIVFGCTDKHLPRAILTQLSLRYLIPVFDMGVLVDSDGGVIRGVHGRVTTLLPGESCLFCRGRISFEAIRIETLSESEREAQIRDGYAPELGEPAPAVIAFTSGIASAALSELLHRLTGFMGKDRQATEVLHNFDACRVRTNRVEARESCICRDRSLWGRGDERPFLGMMWPTYTR